MKLLSFKFNNGGEIPIVYTGLGKNINPPLEIVDPPKNTKCFVLWIEDTSATPKPWIHWLAFNVPVKKVRIAEDDPEMKEFEGLANGDTFGYEGPNQKYFTGTHHYHFRLFALRELLDIPKKSTKEQVEEKMRNLVIDSTDLIGICTSPLSEKEVHKNNQNT